ncbi:CzcA family heavy metal efflux pump [Halanaerobium saccharolyticum]|uniref:CzcA family heavy metal efflux pump n=1 Tax=Halanaerobium saccharolyticum TaxID=43595 RepID=A0A4R7YZ52_9FIRM|nr:efflux RND transporter permease subunit [Halanaerobium saccharolyticum]RAK08482.1 CzcA family heavy metal efflux pump [Halanaerobium saccharolyticum]TDW03483.1 CzcA family heavy metal efflux pump [Halanaerobium saccharolyticum]TDX59974.1 CzcA family heavy metal efflux pump [Halanaerobium saccharolyticum]
MSLVDFAVKKKYTTIAAVLAVILLGAAALLTLNIQLNPDTEPVVVSIQTQYKGVSASDIAEMINEPLEEELGSIEGVESISSDAMEGVSLVSVEFGYDKNINTAAVDVQNVVSRIRNELPADIEEPKVQKFSKSDRPILTLAVNGPRSDTELRTLADNQLKNRLQLVNGVANVDVYGGKKREIQINVDREAMAAYDISISQITRRLDQENINFPGGRLTTKDQEYLLRIVGEYENLEEIRNLIITSTPDGKIYLKDLAEVNDSFAEVRSKFRVEGEETVALNILKQQDANTVQVVDNVKKAVNEMKAEYSKLNFQITEDQSEFVKLAIYNMANTLVIGIILTIIVIFLFLENWRSTLAVSISIPVTFVLTLALLKAFNLSLNTVTMTGLILSIGMLVDNSIVVIENVTRHFEDLDKSAFKAAVEGTNEMILAVIAGTTTSMIVLVPVMFIGGFVQQMFRPLSMTLLFAWTGSVISSFTIVPLVLSMVLKAEEKKKSFKILAFFKNIVALFTKLLESSRKYYLNLLEKSLNNRAIVITTAVVLLIVTLSLIPLIGAEMTPVMDSGQSYISIETEAGSSLAKTEEVAKKVEKIVESVPELLIYSTQLGFEPGASTQATTGANGVQQAFMSLTYKNRNNRERSIWEIQEELRNKIAKVPGIRAYVVEEAGATSVSTTQAPLIIRLSGEEPEILYDFAQGLAEKIKKVPGAVNINLRWALNSPEYHININEKRAAELNLSTREISQQISAAVSGIDALQNFSLPEQDDLNILVKYKDKQMVYKNDLENLMIVSPDAESIPLREIADIRVTKGPNLISREDMQYTLDILGFSKDRALSKINQDIKAVIADYQLPTDYNAAVTGQQDDMNEALSRLGVALVFAVAFIYLLLVSQFKSLLHPITIMISLPLELVGVVAALLLTNTYLSMPAMMGLILLSGIAVNDAIHLIDFVIEAEKEGKSTKEAILEGARLRFRPILMTTFSTLAGMTPLALELAVGTEQYSPLAKVVMGGLFSSTMLLLIFVPVVYSLLEDLKEIIHNN